MKAGTTTYVGLCTIAASLLSGSAYAQSSGSGGGSFSNADTPRRQINECDEYAMGGGRRPVAPDDPDAPITLSGTCSCYEWDATIWFDGELEPAFSTITVYNSVKQQVDKGNSRVTGSDGTVLEVDLPNLAAGSYRVFWKALSKDTHITEGDFTFTITGRSSER